MLFCLIFGYKSSAKQPSVASAPPRSHQIGRAARAVADPHTEGASTRVAYHRLITTLICQALSPRVSRYGAKYGENAPSAPR